MPIKNKFQIKENSSENFVAFIDVMGFSSLVNQNSFENLDSYFSKITDELEKLNQESANIRSYLISDSIILISPKGLTGLKQLINAVRRIQSALLWRKILIRGAISYGQIFMDKKSNIIVGKAFIKAYLLEQEAIFPRIIIDPYIIKLVTEDTEENNDKRGFLKLLNEKIDYDFESRKIYQSSKFSKIIEDGIFVDYANKVIMQDEINGSLQKVYETIRDNLYSDQKLFSKYVWLRDYFLEIMKLTSESVIVTDSDSRMHKRKVEAWIVKFERL